MGARSSCQRAPWLVAASSILLSLLVPAGPAWAGDVHFSAYDLRALFFISKTSNRNRVCYVLRLDSACRPRGDEPLEAYWQNLELGPNDFEDLSMLDHVAYGIAEQRLRRGEEESTIEVVLRALESRPLRIHVRRAGSTCEARVQVSIAGQEATLEQVHVTLDGPFSVRHLDVVGRRADRTAVKERLSP